MIRLDKFLCNNTLSSRKEVKAFIKAGRVRAEGKIITSSEYKIDENAEVLLDGEPIKGNSYVYIIMNKPRDTVCAAKDKDKRTVFDVLPDEYKRKDLFTVGRLDRDTTGLLLITNDGELSHKLLSPSKHVEKVYYAKCEGRLCKNAERLFSEGMTLGSLKLKPARLEILSKNEDMAEVTVTISEGKFHQVKRMLYETGVEVRELKRIKFGSLDLDPDLKEGEARYLTEAELDILKDPAL